MRELIIVTTMICLFGCAAKQTTDEGMTATLLKVGKAAEKSKRYKYAISVYQEAHNLERTNEQVIEHLADNLAKTKQFAKSSSVCQLGLKLNPDNIHLIELLSSNLLAQNRLISASHWIKKCLTKTTNYHCLNNLGLIYDYLGKYKTAHKCYHQSLELNPQSEQTLNNYGLSLILDQQLEKGIDQLIASNTLTGSQISLANLKLITKMKKQANTNKKLAKDLRRKLFLHGFPYKTALNTKVSNSPQLSCQ